MSTPVAAKNLLLTCKELHKPLDFLPGFVKMTFSTIVLFLGIWIGVHFGSQLNAATAIKMPVSLQSYLGIFSGSQQPTQPPLDVNGALGFAEQTTRRMARLEETLASYEELLHVQHNTPIHGQMIEGGHVGEDSDSMDAWERSKDAAIAARTAQHLAHGACYRNSLSRENCLKLLQSAPLEGTELGERCQVRRGDESLVCDPNAKFRSADGSCNHADADGRQKTWGRVHTAYSRLLPADYQDGIDSVREMLPQARYVTLHLASNNTVPESMRTLALVLWSQFVAHDMAQTPFRRMIHPGNEVVCCQSDGSILSPRHKHPFCLPMEIHERDWSGKWNEDFWKFKTRCLNYVRSAPVMRSDCRLGPTEQMNAATHFLDGSTVYGSTKLRLQSLRTGSGGQLKARKTSNGKHLLPTSKSAREACQVHSEDDICYQAGDTRVNQHPHLAALHTIWLRQHNGLAQKLAVLNPHWDDERLFQETRRIVVSQMQHITYRDWLPLLLGREYTKGMNLEWNSNGFSKQYDTNVDPSVTNSFAAAAMRFVHSLLDSELSLVAENRSVTNSLTLQKHFNRPQSVEYEDGLDGLLRGMATQLANSRDLKYTRDVLEHFYRDDSSYGLDVLSLDIQRGRDHGLPGYNVYRERCGLPKAKDFADFETHIPSEVVTKLRKVYKKVDDVDLVVGGLAERPASADALLGPTFRCIVAEQMSRTRRGDAFFYDLGSRPSSFSADQLREIRKTSLSRILCDNSDGIVKMQLDVFHVTSERNQLKDCADTDGIPVLDLSFWQEDENAVLS